MELVGRSRWFALAMPVALAAVASLMRPAPPGVEAAVRPPERACAAGAWTPALEAGTAWYRLDPMLDATGTLSARRLTAGHGATRWSVVLSAESFASGPVGGRLVVGDDDGRRTRLRLLDTGRACWVSLGTGEDVVRSAVLAPDGSALYEHRVDRATRRDLGVWRRPLSDRGARSVRVLPGLAPDASYGPTFSTQLQLAADGRLIVSACGERACRTRVLDPATGAVAPVDGTGPVAGLAGRHLIVLEPCEGLPCPVDAVDLASGAVTRLDEADGPVLAVPDASGMVVLAHDGGLVVVRLAAAGGTEVPGGAGLEPVAVGSTADSGAEAPPGRVAVAPGGRVTDPSAFRFLDPAALQLTIGEVLP